MVGWGVEGGEIGGLWEGGGKGNVWCTEFPLDNVIGVVTFSVLV